jgi:hypothetical protein
MLRRGRFISSTDRARGGFAIRRSVPPRVRIRSITDGRVMLDVSTRRKRTARLNSSARQLLRTVLRAAEHFRGALTGRLRS